MWIKFMTRVCNGDFHAINANGMGCTEKKSGYYPVRKKTNQEKAQARLAKTQNEGREAERIIRRADQESERFGNSAMANSATKVKDHMMGVENPEDDWVEIWGKRIGRFLAVIVILYLVYSLYYTYVAPN